MKQNSAMGLAGCLLLTLFLPAVAPGAATPKIPAIYVFGDSTADVGNNNYLPGNDSKANYPHYGIDFPHSRPTGRFSNGYNGIDFLAISMGFRRSPPPYLSLTNKINNQDFRGLEGVNFASGGSGILDSVGTKGSSITMTQQINYFASFRTQLEARIGTKSANHLLSKSIILISSGGNDLFAFFAQNSSPSNTEIEAFVGTLIFNYKEHIKALYSLGVRKFLLIDVAPVGCTPSARALTPTGTCIDVLNEVAMGFNEAVKVLMADISSALQGMKYTIGSSYAVISTIIANPNYHGYTEVKNACCGAGKLNAQIRCNPNTTYCTNRGHYLFWDTVHPTQATSKKVAIVFSSGHSQFVFPISVLQLVEA